MKRITLSLMMLMFSFYSHAREPEHYFTSEEYNIRVLVDVDIPVTTDTGTSISRRIVQTGGECVFLKYPTDNHSSQRTFVSAGYVERGVKVDVNEEIYALTWSRSHIADYHFMIAGISVQCRIDLESSFSIDDASPIEGLQGFFRGYLEFEQIKTSGGDR